MFICGQLEGSKHFCLLLSVEGFKYVLLGADFLKHYLRLTHPGVVYSSR